MNDPNRIQQALLDASARKERESLVRTFSSALQARLQIPPGVALVLALGEGRERNNHEALKAWVGRQIDTVQGMEPTELMEALERRLTDRLDDFLGSA